jgi:hypothetical protein
MVPISANSCEIYRLEILSGVVHVYGIHIFKKTLHLCTWTVNQRVPLINVLETKYKLTGISGRP